MPSTDQSLSEIDARPAPHNVFFGDVVYAPGGTYGPRVQPNYQLILIHYGHVTLEIGSRVYTLGKGEVALLKPGHREFFSFATATRTRHSWCHFDWSLPGPAATSIETLAFSAPISERMEHLINLGLSLQHDPYALAPSLAHLAGAAFWEFVATQRKRFSRAHHATVPTAVSRVQTYIVQHYAQDLTLRDLSEVACVTPEHLSRLFSRYLGNTPIRYLWSVRVQQSLLRLRHTGLSVEEIAYQCGFKSAAHFSKKFKSLRGQTPSQVRASHLHDAPDLKRLESP